MSQRILGLDLGAYSVKVVGLEPKGRTREFEVVSYVEQPLVSEEAAAETTLSTMERYEIALQALQEKEAIQGDIVVTGIPGEAAAVRLLRFPFADARKIEQALPFELESEIPYDIEDVIYSWSILNPGASSEEGVDVIVAFTERETVREYLALFEKVGIDPRHIRFDSIALADCFQKALFGSNPQSEQEKMGAGAGAVPGDVPATKAAVAIVDIGHSRTNISVVTEQRLVSAQTMLFGGANATKALARELNLSTDEAERGKRKEAFIEVEGAVAQFSDQAKVSDVLKKSYRPVAQRLRQVFQAVRSHHRVNVTRMILLGGGSGILNLEQHFAETLQIRVDSGRQVLSHLGALSARAGTESEPGATDHAEAALALSYAVSALPGGGAASRIDFRTREFAWKGDLDFLRERFVALGTWAAVLLLCFAVGGGARAFILGNEEDALRAAQAKACESITGQKIDSASRCLAIIQERIQAQQGDTIPEWSAVDTFLEVSIRMPPADEVKRKVTELDINEERVRLKINTSDFDGVDQIVTALQKGKCFESVEKGKARNINDGVGFSPQIRIDCDKAPGEPLTEPTVKAKTNGASPTNPMRGAEVDIEQDETEVRPASNVPPSPRVDNPARKSLDDAKSRRDAIRASLRERAKKRGADEDPTVDAVDGPRAQPRRREMGEAAALPEGIAPENQVAPRPVPRNVNQVVRGLREVPSRPVDLPGRSARKKLESMRGRDFTGGAMRAPESNEDADAPSTDEVE